MSQHFMDLSCNIITLHGAEIKALTAAAAAQQQRQQQCSWTAAHL
jgi:hypothetical protein